MDKNKIFSLLMSLAGFTRDVQEFIDILESEGYHPISRNQIRSWRRSQGKGNPVPDFVLIILFKQFFLQKEKDPRFFSLVDHQSNEKEQLLIEKEA